VETPNPNETELQRLYELNGLLSAQRDGDPYGSDEHEQSEDPELDSVIEANEKRIEALERDLGKSVVDIAE